MKLTTLIIVAAILQVSASTFAQKITLSEKNTPLNKVFEKISDQTGYDFIVSSENLKQSKNVTISIQNEDLASALDKIFFTQPLAYVIQEKMVVVSKKEMKSINENKAGVVVPMTISGKVTDTTGLPLPGATIKIKRSGTTVSTDPNGEFTIDINLADEIEVSFVGYETYTLKVQNNQTFLHIVLHTRLSKLNEIQIIGYGTTTKRLNTRAITSVKAADIQKQPVTNVLSALEGRVAGLSITQSSGVSGSAIKVQLNGQNSLIQGSDPFFVIDGVPFAPGNTSISQVPSAATSGISPFSLINPADIESIEILKDADATAIYGSRGANGVMLITTKKGKAGKTMISGNFYTGFSRVTRTMDMLNTSQYVEMRREALLNDGVAINANSAPDLMLWDTTRNTDFKKLLIGNAAHATDGQLSISGGDNNVQFIVSGGFHRETTVYPTALADQKASFRFNLNHSSSDNKFNLNLTGSYLNDLNQLPVSDLATYVNTVPNLRLYDSQGKLAWADGGVSYYNLGIGNPLAFANQTYSGRFQNLNSNLQLSYQVLAGLKLKVNLGYNEVNSNETGLNPSTSLDPASGQLAYSYFGTSSQRSWIIEPQTDYQRLLGAGKISILLGGTLQQKLADGDFTNATNFTSDLLLSSIAAAGAISSSNSNSQYSYEGFYGRISYQLKDRYIFNFSGRRDGSSRFGPSDRFSNFGAIGAAWIFSDEDFFKDKISWLDFGKLRASYGLTGNDQIGDYKYLDTWAASKTTYQGVSTLNPTALYNPSYSWEKNRKAEVGIDLTLLKNRVTVSVDYYRNISNNQLVNYTLPAQTGFNAVLANLDAEVLNKGWQIQWQSWNISTTSFSWSSNFNLTIPRNQLLSFPDLASSSYAKTYIIGQSLSTRAVYHYLGVDPATGVYQIEDPDHNGIYDNNDKTVMKNTDTRWYGGFQNNIRYKNLEFSVFFEFRKQNGFNYLNTLFGNIPGYFINNQPTIVLNRWQKPGDDTNIERFTAKSGPAFSVVYNYLGNSDAVISDASFIRCKNISLSYSLPGLWLNAIHLKSGRIFIQGQNLFTVTGYVGADPENQNMYSLPPLRTITAGLQFTL